MMEKVISKISAAKSAAVLPHINEDPDALGSCFAFAQALRNMGKEAVVYVSGAIEKRLAFMGSRYECYVPGMEHSHDLCVCLDCGDIERIGARKELFYSIGNTLNIDHHYSNTNFADVNYVEGGASSTGQIMYKLFEKMGMEITGDIAWQLYTAICSDTGCFKYSNTSSETMYIAGKLLETGIDNAEISRRLFECEPLDSVRLKAEVTEGLESFYDGRLRMVTMTGEMYNRYNMTPADAPNLVDIPRVIDGTEIAVCFKEQEDGIRINFRSNGECDVSLIAARFGGGGHKKAAGCTVENIMLDEIKEKVVKECGYII